MFDEFFAQFDEIFDSITKFFTDIKETLMAFFESYDADFGA